MNLELRKSNRSKTDEPVVAEQRACGYFRVSTGRQAESDLSIPDQRKQVLDHCAARGLKLVAEYIDAGASGMEEDRALFQKMIERASDDDRPFDVIIVHSFSRFFRDAFGLEMYVRRLAKHGVRLVSITQELGDDPAQVMMRQIIALFDEYQSRENSKHVLRAMKENARQGFYNGSPLPLGYAVEEVEKRGARIKKKLIVDTVEAETIKTIFKLYRLGDGKSGPIGIKAIASWLNTRGYGTRNGGLFGVGAVHKILTNTVYIGQWVFNRRCAKTLQAKPESERIVVDVPAIIEKSEFEAVQASLKSRDPRVAAPRGVTGPILLTGLTVCASCGGAMTLRTGTSKSGAVHKYYTCSTCSRKGKTACQGRSIPMQKLDDLVTEHLSERLFHPERLTAILAFVAARRSEKALDVDRRVTALQTEVSEAEEKLKRLYKMVEEGVTDLDDILRDRLASLKLDRDRAKIALDRIKAQTAAPTAFDSEAIERFGRAMRENIASGDIPFRKAYIQSVVDRIEVDDGIVRIIGDKSTLEQAIAGKAVASGGVRRCVPKWRSLGDSNPCFRRERATSWTARRREPRQGFVLYRGAALAASLSRRQVRAPLRRQQALEQQVDMAGDIGFFVQGEACAEDQAHQAEENRGRHRDLRAMRHDFRAEIPTRGAGGEQVRDHAHGGREKIAAMALDQSRKIPAVGNHEPDQGAAITILGAAAVNMQQQGAQPFRAAALGRGQHGARVGQHVLGIVGDGLLEQALLGLEIEINRALGHAGAGRDVFHPRRGEAALGEGVERRLENFARPLGLAARPCFHRPASPTFGLIDFPVSQ